MSARLLVLALGTVTALAATTTTASAQAPGEYAPEAAPPAAADPCGSPCGGHAMRPQRWSIGLNLGGLSVTPEGADRNDDSADTNFRTSELAVRYRATRHLELELLLSGGRQVLDDDSDGDLAMGGGTLGARYRFRPDRAWDWWLMAGLGGTVIERHESTQEQRDNAMRGHFAFGIGLERRFGPHFALQAEARMLAIGPRNDAMESTPVVKDPAGGMPLPPDVGTTRDDTLSGGTFTFGASLYF